MFVCTIATLPIIAYYNGRMPIPFYLVDAFAERPFTGNPAGVCFPDSAASTSWLQQVDAEINQAMTAFLLPRSDGDWDLRWFTPTIEVDICGHATLASALVLWKTERVGKPADETISFHTRSGVLICSRSGERIEMDFPAEPATSSDDLVLEALGLQRQPVFVGRNRMDVLVVLETPDEVRAIVPDASRISTIDARGVIVTSKSDRPEFDFISRFFAPRLGILEDPVTGSAHCCLGPYWQSVLKKDELVGYQASRRGGVVSVRCETNRVHLGGSAIMILEGRLRS